MNQVNLESKNGAIKVLAIVGFVVLIIFGVWLAVQSVRVLPSAFSSLASIAETVSTRPSGTISVVTEKSIVNAGEAFTVSWNDVGREGTYSFSYDCTDGVAVEIRLSADDVRTITCEQSITLPDLTTSIDVIIESEKSRFIEVPYYISFTETDETETLTEERAKITVVNAIIPQSAVVLAENTSAEEAETPEETATPEVSTPVTPTTPLTVGTPIERKYNYSYTPVSDSNGTVDLQVSFIGVGHLSGKNFVPSATIDNDKRGAFRFEVKNVGTKTSDNWTFEAQLPNGSDFDSKKQTGLKPNERSVITLGFDLRNTKGTEKFSIDVKVDDDIKSSNNSFDWSVKVVD